MAEVGFPPGVVNIVPGYGTTAGQRLAEHPGRRQDRLHRLDRGRAQDRRGVGRQPQAGPARARRQGRQHRLRRRRPRPRRSTARPSPSSTTRARRASPARACSCTRRSPTSSSSGSSRWRARSASATRSTRRPRWARSPRRMHRDRVLAYVRGRARARAARS